MKIILFALSNLMLCISSYAQISWFPLGAKWHYEYGSMLGGGLTTLEVLSEDTLIGNNVYSKILSTTIFSSDQVDFDTLTEVLFVFEENQVVAGYNKYVGGMILYDFNADVGDTLEMYFGGLSPYPFIVDSIGEMEFNGSIFAFQDIRFPNPFDPGEFYEMRVIEGIGSINSHFFHDHTVIQPFDVPFFYFRCYEDANIGLINLSYTQMNCDYIEGITSVIEESNAKPSIFPNPSADIITFNSVNPDLEKIIVVDILGSVRIMQLSTPQELLKMDISHLENGLFFIVGKAKNGEILFIEKITKYGS